MKNGATWRHYIATSDHSGNVSQLIRKDTGAVIARYDYDSYGDLSAIQGVQPTGTPATVDPIDYAQVSENRYRMQSKWSHEPSGLVDFGFRFYAPGIGRWMNRDPIGEEGGLNLYAYVEGDPVNKFDEYGETPVHAAIGTGIIAYRAYRLYKAYRAAKAAGNVVRASRYLNAARRGRALVRTRQLKNIASSGVKINKQMKSRGWTAKSARNVLRNPKRKVSTRDTRNKPDGTQENDPATAFIREDGSYIIRNDRTGDIVQVSPCPITPGWKLPF